jgi:hypothetical protein
MDSWEFLLQKEGSRTWQPIKSSKIAIEAGRYRVVAHSNSSNTEVEICVSHESTEEVPPKRRSQKRSRRTNKDGLMVVIPFTYLKPGKWELRCSCDLMSDLLGKSWQKAVQLQVTPIAQKAEVKEVSQDKPTVTEVAVKSEKSSELDLGLEVAVKDGEKEQLPESEQLQPKSEETQQSQLPLTEVTELSHPQAIQFESRDTDNTQYLQQPVQLEENQIKLTPDLAKILYEQNRSFKSQDEEEILPVTLPVESQTAATNPILQESLLMLDDILHQVLDPLWQELEPAEASEVQIEESPQFVEQLLESGGLNLTLEEDALVAVGKSFNIVGVVDVLNLENINNSQFSSSGEFLFQGTIQYELRDPQNSQLLLNIQHPLPEQKLPLAFSQTLEIPADCNSRLLLGKVTLYSSTSVVLASQPFTVTADLNELLKSILPGTKVMPVAKMLLVNQESPVFTAVTEVSKAAKQEEVETEPVNQVVLDLIDTSQISKNPSLKPVSSQPLPPQIYQPSSSTQKPSKSLQLPNFPRLQPPPQEIAVDAVEVKEEDSVEQLVALAKELFPETTTPESVTQSVEESAFDLPNQETIADKEVVPKEDLIDSFWGDEKTSESPVKVSDSSLEKSDLLENAESSELIQELEFLNSETPASAVANNNSKTISSKPQMLENGDNAFPVVNIQNRFWLRLNSLASDEQFSQWLQSDSYPRPQSDVVEDVEEVTPPLNLPHIPRDVAEVQQSPNSKRNFAEAEEVKQASNANTFFTNFDDSMWEEAEDVGTEFADEHQLQAPVLEKETHKKVEEAKEESPVKETEVEVPQPDWDAQEIVVEDEEEEALPTEAMLQKQEVLGTVDAWEMLSPNKQVVAKAKPVIIPPPQFEAPIPAPTIVLAGNELTAGETIMVRVKLAPNRARLAVKLWLQDRQSRYLLDGPRWLMDLLPDGTGKLEAMTQLVVPFGSVDIRFEAIAIDLDSQRESHKVALDCVVVPSDLVKFGLDEFEA